jgi:hypothetical protein
MKTLSPKELEDLKEERATNQKIIGTYFEKLGFEVVKALKPTSPEIKYIQDIVKTTKDSMAWYLSAARTQKKYTLGLVKKKAPKKE